MEEIPQLRFPSYQVTLCHDITNQSCKRSRDTTGCLGCLIKASEHFVVTVDSFYIWERVVTSGPVPYVPILEYLNDGGWLIKIRTGEKQIK